MLGSTGIKRGGWLIKEFLAKILFVFCLSQALELRFVCNIVCKMLLNVFYKRLEWRQCVIELELIMMLLPALHHQLISVWFAVAISVVHVLRIRTRVREALQAFATLEWLLSRM